MRKQQQELYRSLLLLPVTVEDLIICQGQDPVMFIAIAPTAILYTWSGSGGFGSDSSIAGSVNGTYTVTISDGTCTASASASLTTATPPEIDLGGDRDLCQGTSITFDAGSHPSIEWMDGTTNSTLIIDTATIVRVTVNDGSCSNSDTITVRVADDIEMTPLRPDTTICQKTGDEILLEVVEPDVTVEWQDGSTDYAYTAIKGGEYVATITDKNGCTAADSTVLKDSCGTYTFRLPTIFTPDGPTGIPLIPIEDPDLLLSFITVIDFTVYNRWGMVMFHSEGVLPYWTGFDMNRNKACPTGVYFWIVNFEDVDQQRFAKNGFVELLRPKK